MSAWERETSLCYEVLAPLSPCVAGLDVLSCTTNQISSRRYKEHKFISSLSRPCITLISASLSLPSSCIRSIFVLASLSSSCLSLSLLFLSLPLQSQVMDGGNQNGFVSGLCKREEGELASLSLTGYTACQPCCLGGAERFCTPSPPPPSCPGSSVRSPSFPRLQETCVSVSK